MRNFQPDCYGTDEETTGRGQQGELQNRSVEHWSGEHIGEIRRRVTFRYKPGDACARVPVYWKSW